MLPTSSGERITSIPLQGFFPGGLDTEGAPSIPLPGLRAEAGQDASQNMECAVVGHGRDLSRAVIGRCAPANRQ